MEYVPYRQKPAVTAFMPPYPILHKTRHGFEDLGMNTIWCGYYEGNQKSKRVQEKVGFVYHHTCEEVPVPLLKEVRTGHTNVMTKTHWEEINEGR